MKTDIFTLADSVETYEGGKLVIVGTFDRIHAKEMPCRFRPFGIAIKASPDTNDYNKVIKLKVLIRKEKAKKAIFEFELETKFAKANKDEIPKVNIVLQSGPVELDSYGKYVCELRDSKKTISKIFFHVVKPDK